MTGGPTSNAKRERTDLLLEVDSMRSKYDSLQSDSAYNIEAIKPKADPQPNERAVELLVHLGKWFNSDHSQAGSSLHLSLSALFLLRCEGFFDPIAFLTTSLLSLDEQILESAL